MMITIFNRKELLSTNEMQRQAQARQRLADSGIDYQVKVINRKSPSPLAAGSRAYTGTFGEKLEFAYTYIIYVKRTDFSRARAVIEGKV